MYILTSQMFVLPLNRIDATLYRPLLSSIELQYTSLARRIEGFLSDHFQWTEPKILGIIKQGMRL